MSSESLMSATVIVISVFAAAMLQYWFTRKIEHRRLLVEKRATAYSDVFRALAGCAKYPIDVDAVRNREFLTLLADARSRINIYAGEEVAQRFALLFRGPQTFADPSARANLVSVAQAIRSEFYGNGRALSDDDTFALLFV